MDVQIKVFIIGSISCMERIIEATISFMDKGCIVKHVKPEPDKSLEYLIDKAFNNIKEADLIVAVEKNDGSLGEGTLYELAFAKYLNKEIILF